MKVRLWTILFLNALNLGSTAARVMYMIDAGSYNFDFVYNFTKHLHSIHRFNSFVIFRDETAHKQPAFIYTRSLEQALVDDFGQSIIVLGPQSVAKLRQSMGLNNLVFVDISSMEDPMLHVVAHSLEGLRYMPMLFIFKRPHNITPSVAEIQKFFSWCWSVNIVNVALTFQVITRRMDKNNNRQVSILIQNQVYTYTPFPKITVQNMTEFIYTKTVFISDMISNVNGYTFETPVFADPPLVFLTPYEKHSHHMGERNFAITGSAGRLYHEYIYSINGTIRLVPYSNISFYSYHKEALLLAAVKTIDIGIHPFSALLEFANQTEGSYPIGQTNACIIVPVVQEIFQEQYFVHTFGSIIWLLIILTFVGLIILQSSMNWLWEKGRFDFGHATLYAFQTLLYQPLTLIEFDRRQGQYKFVHLVMLLFCFIVTNMFSTSMTSLLSTTVWGDQIVTLDDFLASDLEIMLHKYERKIYFDNERLPDALRSRLRIVDLKTLNSHRDALNTTYAYVVTQEKWKMLSMQQQLMWKPRFRIASDSLCTGNYFQKFPLQWDSPFALSLAIFFMTIQERGLDLKWEELSLYQANEMNLINIIEDQFEHPKPLNIYHVKWALVIYTVMSLFSLLSFLCEVVYAKTYSCPSGGFISISRET